MGKEGRQGDIVETKNERRKRIDFLEKGGTAETRICWNMNKKYVIVDVYQRR